MWSIYAELIWEKNFIGSCCYTNPAKDTLMEVSIFNHKIVLKSRDQGNSYLLLTGDQWSMSKINYPLSLSLKRKQSN